MDVFDFLLSIETIKAVFKLGFLPSKEEFYELTPDQYEQYYASNEPANEKVFMLLPDDPQKYNEIAVDDVFVVTEHEISSFESAGETIENYCKNSGRTFATFDEKLYYVAEQMPAVFSKGTKYAKTSALYLRE
jgi:hypothetical protein